MFGFGNAKKRSLIPSIIDVVKRAAKEKADKLKQAKDKTGKLKQQKGKKHG